MELYYIQINLMCMLVLGVVAIVMNNDRENNPARRQIFFNLIFVAIAMSISDIFAWLSNGQSFQGARFMIELFNIIYDITITVAGYVWTCYVNLRVDGLENYSRKRKIITAIPMLFVCLYVASNPITGLCFTIDVQNVYSRSDGLVVHWIVSWGYLIYATAKVWIALRKTDSKVEKRQLRPLIMFIIPPALAAVMQMLFYGVTSTQCGMSLSIIIIAFTAMRDKVSTDSLTDLNNRNAFDNYISERLMHQNFNFKLMMCDIDSFKTINDTMGHVVGDIVLKRMADLLKTVCAESRAALFLCRYGGDEFVICTTDVENADMLEIKRRIGERLIDLNRDYPSEIRLGLSIGCAADTCRSGKDIEKLIGSADEEMYREKQLRHAVR